MQARTRMALEKPNSTRPPSAYNHDDVNVTVVNITRVNRQGKYTGDRPHS